MTQSPELTQALGEYGTEVLGLFHLAVQSPTVTLEQLALPEPIAIDGVSYQQGAVQATLSASMQSAKGQLSMLTRYDPSLSVALAAADHKPRILQIDYAPFALSKPLLGEAESLLDPYRITIGYGSRRPAHTRATTPNHPCRCLDFSIGQEITDGLFEEQEGQDLQPYISDAALTLRGVLEVVRQMAPASIMQRVMLGMMRSGETVRKP